MNMLRPSVNQLITKNESSYSLVIGVAKRAREIADELYENGKTSGIAENLVRRRGSLCGFLYV